MLNCCRNDDNARDLTANLARCAIVSNRPQFREALYLVTLALKARTHSTDAAQELDSIMDKTVSATPSQIAEQATVKTADETTWRSVLDKCDGLRDQDDGRQLYELLLDIKIRVVSSFEQAQGDTWGFRRRRIAALAQAYHLSHLSIRRPGIDDLVKSAMATDVGGFPGCHMLALFFLAENLLIMNQPARAQDALKLAFEKALATQDARHCAINVSRVRAMQAWCDSSEPMWNAIVEEFLADPEGPPFAAVHVIGDRFGDRVDLRVFREARTLEQLRAAYGWYALSAFERLNPEWVDNKVIPNRERIQIPNPSFAALMACRLAAGVVSDDRLSKWEKVRLVQSLVRVTLKHPTALNIILSRLVLAAEPPIDLLEEIYKTGKEWAEKYSETMSSNSYKMGKEAPIPSPAAA